LNFYKKKEEELINRRKYINKRLFILAIMLYIPYWIFFFLIESGVRPALYNFNQLYPIFLLVIGLVLPAINMIITKLHIISLSTVESIYNAYEKYYNNTYEQSTNNDKKEQEYSYQEKSNNANQSNSNETISSKCKIYLEFMGLDCNATKQDIKKQYRKIANEIHPDKMFGKGEKIIEQALAKMQKLNEVNEYLKINCQ